MVSLMVSIARMTILVLKQTENLNHQDDDVSHQNDCHKTQNEDLNRQKGHSEWSV